MFTGIIQEIGAVSNVRRSKGIAHISVYAPKTACRVSRLESVAIDGVCLSIVSVRKGTLSFEMIEETQRLTTLGLKRCGSYVNVEPSLCISDRLNGHFVFGHVDGVGTVIGRNQLAGELALDIRLDKRLHKFLVPKGNVALDGVSLTVGDKLGNSSFRVHLIPETLRNTTLQSRLVGNRLNIELDYFAKLIWQFLQRRDPT